MTIVKHSIDAEMAEKAVAAAATKATELKLKMCIAVADEAGDLKAFLRMDGAPKLSIGIAQDKAYTAEPLAKFIERGEFSLCSRGGAAGAQAGAGLSCVTRSI